MLSVRLVYFHFFNKGEIFPAHFLGKKKTHASLHIVVIFLREEKTIESKNFPPLVTMPKYFN